MATEKLKFNLELYATWWDKKPTCEILINDKVKWSNEIDGSQDKPTTISFEHEVNEGDKVNLILNRQNKTLDQTVVVNEQIEKDQLLHIKSIEIDEINIGGLIYQGLYKPQYPEPWATTQKNSGNNLPETLKSATVLGHNGTWTFTFESPFYMWLLENLY